MDWQAALLSRLKADATITGLVNGRIYWVTRPQLSGLPAITLQLIADDRAQHMEGFQRTRSSIVQADCWADSETTDGHALAYEINEAVIACLVPKLMIGGVQFLRSFVNTTRDLSEQAGTKLVNRTSTDLTIWHCPA